MFEGLEKELKSYITSPVAIESLRGSVTRVSFATSVLVQGGLSSIFPRARSLFRDKSLEFKSELSNDVSSISSIGDIDENQEGIIDIDETDQIFFAHLSETLPVRPDSRSENSLDRLDITSLCYIPGKVISRLIGRISLHFVKVCLDRYLYNIQEANVLYENGTGCFGMGGFKHIFLTEMYSVLRSYAKALGGNSVREYWFLS
jgi:hypothetical protein